MLRRAIADASDRRGAGQGRRAAQPDLRLAAPGRYRRQADQHDHVGRLRRPVPAHDRARDRADRATAGRVHLARARKRRPPRGRPLLGRGFRDGLEGRAPTDPEKHARRYMHSIARAGVAESLQLTGLPLDAHGVTGGSDFSCSSISDWRRAIGSWLSHPEDNRVLIATSILLDGRPVFGPEELDPKQEYYEAEERDTLLRWMLRLALAAKPPTGFRKDMVAGALGRAPRHPGHQARGPAPDRRHRPLRGTEGRAEDDVDRRAAAGRERRRRARGSPTRAPWRRRSTCSWSCASSTRSASSSAARSPTTTSIRRSSTRSPGATCATGSAR